MIQLKNKVGKGVAQLGKQYWASTKARGMKSRAFKLIKSRLNNVYYKKKKKKKKKKYFSIMYAFTLKI